MTELLYEPPNPFAHQDLSFIDTEEAKNYMRELRLFMRAALVEMFKEKKLSPLCRPVDPDQVPDYYDVITAPMDLETVRSKVDEGLYPTYRCFYYDLEQIGFNAMTYNPLDNKDIRGKQIVHAAKSLLDMVETHAYNFKNRLGYDLFKRCDVIASSPNMLRAVSDHKEVLDTLVFAKAVDSRFKNKNDIKRIRSVIPRENEGLYKAVLDRHMEIKAEMGEEHPSFGTAEDRLEKLAADINDYRSGTSNEASSSKNTKRFGMTSIDDSSLRRSSRGRDDGGEATLLSLEDIEALKRKKRKLLDGSSIHSNGAAAEEEDVIAEPNKNDENQDDCAVESDHELEHIDREKEMRIEKDIETQVITTDPVKSAAEELEGLSHFHFFDGEFLIDSKISIFYLQMWSMKRLCPVLEMPCALRQR